MQILNEVRNYAGIWEKSLPDRVNSYPEPGRCGQKAAEVVRAVKGVHSGRESGFYSKCYGKPKQASERI